MDIWQFTPYRGLLALLIPSVFLYMGLRGFFWARKKDRAGEHAAAREGYWVAFALLAICPVAIHPVVGILPGLGIVAWMILLVRHVFKRPLVRQAVGTVGFLGLAAVSAFALSGIRPGTSLGPSMWPSSPRNLSLSWIDTHAYMREGLSRGDGVEFAVSNDNAAPDPDTGWPAGRYHKRVWALPGDDLRIEPLGISLNGKLVADCRDTSRPLPMHKWLCRVSLPQDKMAGPTVDFDIVWGRPDIWFYNGRDGKMGPNQVFVVGDNTVESSDSRDRGAIPSSWVTGKSLHF